MRGLAGLLAAALLYAGPALAGAPHQRTFSWTGCYVGAAGGGAWDDQNVSTSGSPAAAGNQAPSAGTLSGSSGIVSLYAGCNWEFAPAWVLGVEGDFSWTNLDASASAANLFFDGTPVGVGGINWSHDLDRLGSVRARLGYAVTADLLLFATGGIAWEHSDFAAVNTGTAASRSTAFSRTQDGYVVGGGGDWAWRDNWVLRLEYLHYDFPGASSTVFFTPTTPSTFVWDHNSVDSVRAGLSYKF